MARFVNCGIGRLWTVSTAGLLGGQRAVGHHGERVEGADGLGRGREGDRRVIHELLLERDRHRTACAPRGGYIDGGYTQWGKA